MSGEEARLEKLIEQGAVSFDPEGCRFIRRLLESGLEARARLRLDRLSDEMDEMRLAAERIIHELKLREARIPAELVDAMARGDFRAARRSAKIVLQKVEAQRPSAVQGWALSVARRARARSVRLSRDLEIRLDAFIGSSVLDSGHDEEMRALASEASRALFQESVASTRATIAVARATDNVPESAGPYNTDALAAQALAALAGLAPSYLGAYVAHLDDLWALEPLNQLELRPSSPPRRKRG